MDALFLKIEEAETCRDEACAIEEAIVALSTNPIAAHVLIRELKQSVIDTETKRREIETSPEFKARYSNRDSAYADFLREYYHD